MKGIYLLLGSNLGDRLATLRQASQMIGDQIGVVVRQSSIYLSEAWGLRDQPDFLNQVLEIDSNLEPLAVLDKIITIEKQLGRRRIIKWGERAIDIDILYYGDHIIKSRRLTIPDQYISSRRFTLLPLCEIEPSLVHPVLKKDQCTLLSKCDDELMVVKLTEEEISAIGNQEG